MQFDYTPSTPSSEVRMMTISKWERYAYATPILAITSKTLQRPMCLRMKHNSYANRQLTKASFDGISSLSFAPLDIPHSFSFLLSTQFSQIIVRLVLQGTLEKRCGHIWRGSMQPVLKLEIYSLTPIGHRKAAHWQKSDLITSDRLW